jgi:hypothetical protein
MSLPTIESMTSRYLYGTDTPPVERVDEALIRPGREGAG